MELLTSPISRHNRYSQNHQRNVYHIKQNLVRQIVSANSRINEYSENKAIYINIQEIYWLYSSYNQHTYLFILYAY
jgi:hypothetical protein